MPVAVLLGQVGQLDQLVAGEASAQDACAHGRQTGLLLRRDADVVAIDVVGNHILVNRRGVEFAAELRFDRFQHGLRGPAVAHEEVLDAGAGAVLAQLGLLLEDAQHGFHYRIGLVLRDEGGDAHSDVRLGRKASTDAQRVTDLFQSIDLAPDCGKRNAVDLRIRAPQRAAGDRHLELARQVVELRIRRQSARHFHRQRAGVDQFVAVEPGERTAGDVAQHVSAGALGAEADCGQRFHDLR